MNKKKNEKGFSLVELLVVVIIIAIVAAIAIPNLLASRRAATEASAISTLRTYHSAEATYQATTGASTAYGNEVDLVGLVDAILSTDNPTKSGYVFNLAAGGTGNATYCATATPSADGSSGDRVFAVSVDGVIYSSGPWNGTAYPNIPSCAAGVLTVNGATPIGGTAAPAPPPGPAP
jgi:prepilin-type N-terminal cleavage/methylation domain-containing protein